MAVAPAAGHGLAGPGKEGGVMAFGDNAITIDWDAGHTAGAADGDLEVFGETSLIRLDVTAGVTYNLGATAFSWIYSSEAVIGVYDAAGTLLQVSSVGGDTTVLSYAASSTGAIYVGITTRDAAPSPYDFFVSTSGATDKILGSGDDTYTGAANERILGGNGDDTITLGDATEAFGGQADDLFYGNDFGDRIAGGDGNDYIYGGGGNDTVWCDAGIDIVFALGGNDLIFGGDGYDYISGDDGNDTIHGGNGADRLFGDEGDDIIDGGAGADYMEGDNGNNTYYVDNVADQVVGFNGMPEDTVYTSVSYALSGGADVGMLRTTDDNGTQAIDLTGSGLAQTLIRNAGDNVLDGMAGADTMRGLGGNDLYVRDNAGDVVDESLAGSSGFDSVRSALAINLSDGAHFKGTV
jgi:Ca2+-binding RTX toxin-like protein